jgi:hypothetical protein
MAKTIESILAKCSNAILADAYNSVSERRITKFSDHSTAVKRTLAALEAAGKVVDDKGDGVLAIVDAGKAARSVRDGDESKITVVADSNPKARGSKSHKRFGLYKTGMTVADYVAAASKLGGGRRKAIRDITWDVAHGYIRLS